MVIYVGRVSRIYSTENRPQGAREISLPNSPRAMAICPNAFQIQEWSLNISKGHAKHSRPLFMDLRSSLHQRHHNILQILRRSPKPLGPSI